MLKEALQLDKSIEQVSNIPLIVIKSGKTEMVYKNWIESQKSLLSLSTNHSHIIIENSGHFNHLEQPEKVSDAIKNLIMGSWA